MSFILDALKKAESERSRNSGPVLMDVRVAPTRQRLPAWAWMLAFALLANLLVLAWLLLRRPAAPASIAASTNASVAAAPAQPAGVPVAIPPAVIAPVAELPAPQPVTAPLPLPAPIPSPTVSPPAVTATPLNVDNLPTMQEVLASGVTLPPLLLSLHAYDEAPANRYVLLNSKRLREGDELPDGIKVERITPRGVVLDIHGRRFLLVAGG
jgi:general secretion pathway protein B